MQSVRSRLRLLVACALAAALPVACGGPTVEHATSDPGPDPAAVVAAFLQRADAGLRERMVATEQASWNYVTDLSDENAALSARAEEASMAFTTGVIREATTFDGVEVPPDMRRQLELLKLSTGIPAPDDDARRAELAELMARIAGLYGKGRWCRAEGDCLDLDQLENVLSHSRDYDEQLAAWVGWRSVSPPMRADYQRFVELSNEGARALGYADTGALWRSKYDLTPAEFEAEVERLWRQVEPLYLQLHCLVRARLTEQYGADKVPPSGPIPAHLLGNMWAQSWENLYPLVEPSPGQPSLDVSAALQAQGYDPRRMVRAGEAFFVSLGLDPLPETFWERSMLEKPADRPVMCHASAWDVNYNNDLRISMCVEPTMEDLVTIHHELGHNYYYHYYYELPMVYQSGANDGFHEAIGDAVALSITPGYLAQLGLLESVNESPELVLNKQMQDALAKIAFLPFGRMIDQWRWDVFSGKVGPDAYNAHWWTLRQQYQGVAAPVARSEDDFDPGAKFHIPTNVPYMRYFLAHVLQFQFHAALCEAAGHTGPLHQCSIYGSKEAGERLRALLALGASRPWPEALEAMTGSREMSAEPLIAYFAPLMTYLEAENAGRQCGW